MLAVLFCFLGVALVSVLFCIGFSYGYTYCSVLLMHMSFRFLLFKRWLMLGCLLLSDLAGHVVRLLYFLLGL